MNDELRQAFEAARKERAEITRRINEMFGRMRIDDPISLSPFGPGPNAGAVVEAARGYIEEVEVDGDEEIDGGHPTAVRVALDAYDATHSEFSEHSTPVVVLSLAGLRRLEALLSELEQRRDG